MTNTAEVMGVPLSRLEYPIQVALEHYQDIADNGLVFDAIPASQLTPTPDKPNSARSETDVLFRDIPIGKLYVLAFKPGDGTGSEVFYRLSDLEVAFPYPINVGVIPRDKVGVYNEGHLTIATHELDDVHADPELYSGRFDLLGLSNNQVVKIGELGQPGDAVIYEPAVTLTVGYDSEGNRFGDPHAVYSDIAASLQVCAFLAVSDAIQQLHPDLLKAWNPHYPHLK
jgi:hypothetical protein